MGLGLAQAGLLWQWWKYDTRMWLWGTDDLRVMGMAAASEILPGTLVQVVPGTNTVRMAQDSKQPVGVSCYNPNFHSPAVKYEQFDMVPIVRKGRVYAALNSLKTPGACATVSWNSSASAFTADALGFSIPRICFSVDTEQQYMNTDGSPQADVPFPVPPPPYTADITVFAAGGGNTITTCLLEVNFP